MRKKSKIGAVCIVVVIILLVIFLSGKNNSLNNESLTMNEDNKVMHLEQDKVKELIKKSRTSNKVKKYNIKLKEKN